MAFHDVRLLEEVESGASGGPEFKTSLLETTSGREQRNATWSEMRAKWDIAYGIDEESFYYAVLEFFYARRGMFHTFRFRDWADYTITDGVLAEDADTANDFPVIKVYEVGGVLPYVRRITRPVESTILVSVGGTPTGGTGWTFVSPGIIRFAAPPGGAVTISCEFDVPVRFDTDEFNLQLELVGIGSIGTLPVVEVRE